jgi:hypothetical protein
LFIALLEIFLASDFEVKKYVGDDAISLFCTVVTSVGRE